MSTVAETLFAPLTIATAPDSSRPILENIKKANGFVPNLMAIFANNPTVLQGYLALDGVYETGSFTPRERQLILLAASVENHAIIIAPRRIPTIAKGALRIPAEIVAAIRNNTTVPDARSMLSSRS